MSNHTSGPWKCERLVNFIGEPYSTFYEAHIDLGTCMIWAPPGNEEQEANARLIAASPDLLGTLKWVLPFLHLSHEQDRVREAIAKAEGNQ